VRAPVPHTNTARQQPPPPNPGNCVWLCAPCWQNVTAEGRIIVWPAQVLETWWCEWQSGVGFTDCCADDAPSISAMITLLTKLVTLPPGLLTAQQLAEFQGAVLQPSPGLACVACIRRPWHLSQTLVTPPLPLLSLLWLTTPLPQPPQPPPPTTWPAPRPAAHPVCDVQPQRHRRRELHPPPTPLSARAHRLPDEPGPKPATIGRQLHHPSRPCPQQRHPQRRGPGGCLWMPVLPNVMLSGTVYSRTDVPGDWRPGAAVFALHPWQELYPIHPHRMFTKGKEVATGLDISVAVRTYTASNFAGENSGWNYGLNAASLLGLSEPAARQVQVYPCGPVAVVAMATSLCRT
jgi:hypothetical protein